MFLEIMDLTNTVTNFLFITGSDLSEFRMKINNIVPNDTIFIVSSKSFKTLETLTLLKEAIKWSGDISKFVAITANKNEAKKHNINCIIEFDQEIGGRYSIWSEISILFYWLNKENFNDFMAGGRQADIDLQSNEAYLKFVKIYHIAIFGFIISITKTQELFFLIFGHGDHYLIIFSNLKWSLLVSNLF